MVAPITLAKNKAMEMALLPSVANRHGLIAGATGTGKTVTLQRLAHGFSSIGVPVFMADVKGDLSGIAAAGALSPKLEERLKKLELPTPAFAACPTVFWDFYGENGHPIRTTISELGPLLISRILDLNDTQEGVLNIVFRLADEKGLLLLDLKDLKAMLQYAAENAAELQKTYGNISSASVGAIQRGLLNLETQGGDRFLGEPALDVMEFLRTDASGQGVVNLLSAEKLFRTPKLYSTFLLWMLSELFENLPEAGDLEKPKLVFFFDEAHLLFKEAPPVLLERIEQMVRLIRSKGVGVYFISQSPGDIPDAVLAQLGNRVQHALRAFTPKDKKLVKTVADTMRPNPNLDTEKAVLEMGVGEAVVSLLDEQGTPGVVERGFVLPPASRIGPLSPDERKKLISASVFAGKYDKAVDRESAYERLAGKPAAQPTTPQATPAPEQPAPAKGGIVSTIGAVLNTHTGKTARSQTVGEVLLKTTARSVGNQIGRELVRGILGTLMGGGGGRRR